MKTTFSALVVAAGLLVASAVQAADPGVGAAIGAFSSAFNKGDVAAVKAQMTSSPTIIDEVSPHLWSGAGSLDTWLADLGKSEAAEGKTGGVVSIGAPSREVISGDRAYAIAPSTYTFKQKGMTMRETGEMTFVLARSGSGWKITSFVWTSPDAVPLK